MNFNPQIRIILQDYKIPVDEGLTCLLALHFNLKLTAITESVWKQVNLTKIVERDYQNNILKWNIPLFEGQNVLWDWIGDWRQGFKNINPERAGDLSAVIQRMKKIFSENPDIRKEEVFAARDLYFRSVSEPTYLKMSHKFIYDGAGVSRTSMLLTYIERVREQTISPTINKGLI